jgi:hypothetical protein
LIRLKYQLQSTDRDASSILSTFKSADPIAMSHKHEHLLHTIFQDPISGNIHWREIESLLHHLGANVEPIQGARFRVVLNGVEGFLHHPHHSNVLQRQDVKNLRLYLASARVTPSLYELDKKD